MTEPSAPPFTSPYTMADLGGDGRRSAPAALRNVGPIGDVLAEWLPPTGIILELASGSGEHALAFARRFADLQWQPSDPDPAALASIAAWRDGGPANLLSPIALDAAGDDWSAAPVAAYLCINMVHVSPWASAQGLARGAGRGLARRGRLILYGPWIVEGEPLAESNAAFDRSLKARDPRWGLRRVSEFAAIAEREGLRLVDRRAMPANNQMLCFERG